MKSIALVAFGLLLLGGTSAHADMPPVKLVAVRLYPNTSVLTMDHYYSTETLRGHYSYQRHQQETKVPMPVYLDGYLLWSTDQPEIRFASATASAQLAGHRGELLQFWRFQDVFAIRYPIAAIVSTTSVVGMEIPISIVKKVEKIKGEFDDRTVQDGDFEMISPVQAKLLSSGPPVYSCVVPWGETGNEFLISYNPGLNKETMSPLCNKNSDPKKVPVDISDEEMASFLKNKNTFTYAIVGD